MPNEASCLICKCTETKPCRPPCSWFDDKAGYFPGPVCSGCWTVLSTMSTWLVMAHKPSVDALTKHAHKLAAQRILRGSSLRTRLAILKNTGGTGQ